ncbi:MAG TPA: 2-dehydro-3-deoxygalactonokinase [Edaphobacter sp.]|nr:2-dehydro-3-deoxygalactonokinase [Edaphobacter sp.]
MIGVDWGTSNFRAFRLASDGSIVGRRSSARGILQVEPGGFAEALENEIGEWLSEGEEHVLLCGMVGSRQGWVEAEYLACPAGADELAAAVVGVPFDRAEVRLVPGMKSRDADGVPEVMRGEETQVAGLLDTCSDDALLCLPGTHSKWVRLHGGKVAGFTTSMTGEVYRALRKHTILGRSMVAGDVDREAFLHGVERAATAGGLLHHLFGVRTLGLMDELRAEASAGYLSGLLIGHEVGSEMPKGAQVHLVGDEALCSLYRIAIEACGGSATIEDEDAAARGLTVVARRMGWI